LNLLRVNAGFIHYDYTPLPPELVNSDDKNGDMVSLTDFYDVVKNRNFC